MRDPEGAVRLDLSGKANGRGAYLCANETCIATAQKRQSLNRSLKASPDPSLFAELLEEAARRA